VIPVALISLSALVAPPALVKVTAGGAVLSPPAQWELILACPRLKLDGERGYASTVVVGHKGEFTYLLTADHAVKDVSDLEVQFYTRRSYPLPAFTAKAAATEVYSKEADFALLRILTPYTYPSKLKKVTLELLHLPLIDPPPPMLKLPPPNRRPKRFPFDAVSVGCPGGAPPTCLAETIRAKRFARDEKDAESVGSFVWEAVRTQQSGRSGGPLVSADGTVIGICRAKSADRGYYTHLDEIQAELKQKGYEFLWEAVGKSK
jgi:Trypsin-like peptidase domain